MSRLYTFGCSFTNYKWNTWADIIGRDYEVFENWGQSGAGNQFVLNSLTECIQRNCLDSNDVVMIMWSTPCRYVRCYDNHPTTQMYLEYLQTVLPNYVLPDSSPREKTKHGYEFERF